MVARNPLASGPMRQMTRREWTALTAGCLAGAPFARLGAQARPSVVAGVRLGAQSYSFRDRPLAGVVTAMQSIGLGFCELWQSHVETAERTGAAPEMDRAARREALRTWRLGVPMSDFSGVRDTFAAAGITITAYNLSFQDDFT